MKTIRELSEELKISKEAIYKKIKFQLKEELADHVIKVNNVTHIDEFGERILFESLSMERQQAIQQTFEPDADGGTDMVTGAVILQDAPFQPVHSEFVRLLQEQLRLKDQQIDVQNEHITQLITQTGYGQMLLKTSLYKNTLLLQAPATKVKVRKSFWASIFKR